MHEDVFDQITTRLRRAIKAHEDRLRVSFDATVAGFEPQRPGGAGALIHGYAQAILSELHNHAADVRGEAVGLAREFLIPLTPETQDRLLEQVRRCLDEAGYEQRINTMQGALRRRSERAGIPGERIVARFDIEGALLQAGVANIVRDAVSALRADLEFETLRATNDAAKSTVGAQQLPFASLAKDVIDIYKHGGSERAVGRKASVQSDRIFMEAAGVLVEPNDLIIRRMSNGGTESFRVIDPGFSEGLSRIPANYQMIVRKLGLPEAAQAAQIINTYNFHGDNARFNQNSVDNSVNVVAADPRLADQLALLRAEIGQLSMSDADRDNALELVDEVESAIQSGKKRSVVSALLDALPPLANVAAIAEVIKGLFS